SFTPARSASEGRRLYRRYVECLAIESPLRSDPSLARRAGVALVCDAVPLVCSGSFTPARCASEGRRLNRSRVGYRRLKTRCAVIPH
ncbi:MAG: hypothetical protein QGG36_30045, partial [Pirellulaceae bacterium]|nr:hypothetical protein [Pirellulaceae bacterium]